jgi:hypothetical protein
VNQQITGTGMPEEYLSYVLRIWCEGKHGSRWLSSLQNPITGERIGFADMDELFEFLRKKTCKQEEFIGDKNTEEVTDQNLIDNPAIRD